ncbi:MAG TPA: ABC transporter permease [Acidobacteriota bacterium]|nr:ABC transporter permease [Acidobacteriota bacterium]
MTGGRNGGAGARRAGARHAGLERILGMVRKEFLQIFRDPHLYRIIFVAPVIQLLVFGYAVSTDVRNARTFVLDHDRTALSREYLESFTASGYFTVVGRSERSRDLVDALERGDAVIGIEIPAGFARSVAGPEGARVQLVLDGTNANTANIVRGYAERITQAFATRMLEEGRAGGAVVGAAAAGGPAGSSGAIARPIELRERAWFNAELASRNYNVPAVAGAIILLVCMLLTSLAVVREREIGTLEQLMVSPLKPIELIAGKTIPFALIGLADMVVVSIVGIVWFGVPFRGDPLLLVLATLLYLMSGLGIGLLISTVASTQQQAFMVSFLVLMPLLLLSGFTFPVSSMPDFFQWITLLDPVRHYMAIVRALFLKGSGLDALWPEYLTLLVMGVAVLGFAATRFRKTVG